MALLATTAAIATTAALNAALGFSADIRQLRDDRQFSARLQQFISRLGDRITLYHLLELADQNADALWFEGRSWSYGALKLEVDRLAFEIHALGVVPGDIVSVFMTNSPEMIFTIYALSKLAASPALINSALRDDTLLHCIRVANASKIICTPDLAVFASIAIASSEDSVLCLSFNLGSFKSPRSEEQLVRAGVQTLVLSGLSDEEISKSLAQVSSTPRSITDIAALIYTSGTTGKPKACSLKNIMVCLTSCPSSADMSDLKRYFPVRTYSCMPIFHGTTFLTGLCYCVGTSGTFCVSRKFSVSKFWKEMAACRATRMLYVGELCRYLCVSPPTAFDQSHACIVATGNGLQKDVWKTFQKRFNVPEIREYYRSTEGLVKYDNRNRGRSGKGKIGYAGLLKRMVEDDIFIVRFDHETEQPLREQKSGFCIPARPGEAGEAICRIKDIATYTNYHGNDEATNSKILRNVFQNGDMFQRSGDLILQEKLGWIRFYDRIGETFRWKGENVGAGEVSSYICELDNVHDAIVVGKKLSGYDGQAGAAAVTLKSHSPEAEATFITALYPNLKRKGVPAYAFPRLVTISQELAMTATFKHAKQALKAKNWDPEASVERSYWLDGKTYKVLDQSSWSIIEAGKAKL